MVLVIVRLFALLFRISIKSLSPCCFFFKLNLISLDKHFRKRYTYTIRPLETKVPQVRDTISSDRNAYCKMSAKKIVFPP